MSAQQSQAWLVPQLLGSVQAALSTPWILDIDTTIKPLYGKQEGAQVSYNPRKPGRPSHALHTYWVGNLRLVLDVVVSPGLEHSAAKARPGLTIVLDSLTAEQRPALVRGDCGFGNEPFIAELESRAQPYLFKLRQTQGVKRLLSRQFSRDDWSVPGPSDQGWSAVEDTLKLSGWDRARRVVVLRRSVKADLALSRKNKNEPGEQIELLMPDKDVQAWEYAVLVTNSAYALEVFGQLYRDRADCENGFDELKNQWGWGGFTTQDIERCQSSARAVALVYNWWSWYCRAAKPGARMEAITSRALLLAGVGRAVKHAGQTTLYLTPMHAAIDKLMALIA
ncbi:transposase (plasmid) [Polaromonas sp. P1-6]|nr:transposase [Polaromonas sp. P1-6]